MRGVLHLLVVRRVQTDSKRYNDKWQQLDKLRLISTNINGTFKVFRIISMKAGFGEFVIGRDEVAFIKLIYRVYGSGDYIIRCWIKGKEKTIDRNTGEKKMIGKSGIRTFWDGIVTNDRMFYRRKSTGYSKESPSMYEKTSFADSEQRIANFMKTKRPAVWWNF